MFKFNYRILFLNYHVTIPVESWLSLYDYVIIENWLSYPYTGKWKPLHLHLMVRILSWKRRYPKKLPDPSTKKIFRIETLDVYASLLVEILEPDSSFRIETLVSDFSTFFILDELGKRKQRGANYTYTCWFNHQLLKNEELRYPILN